MSIVQKLQYANPTYVYKSPNSGCPYSHIQAEQP